MKNKASGLLKRIISGLKSMAKANTLTLKRKTNALRTRLIIFSLLTNKKFTLTSISHKFNALVGHKQQHIKEYTSDDDEEDDDAVEDQSNAIVLYKHNSVISLPSPTQIELLAEDDQQAEEQEQDDQRAEEEEVPRDDNKYTKLTQSMLEYDEEEDDGELDEDDSGGGSVIELVKNLKKEGEQFKLEDEIDHVADLFIRKFHRQMRLQKQLSLKRQKEEMLQRNA